MKTWKLVTRASLLTWGQVIRVLYECTGVHLIKQDRIDLGNFSIAKYICNGPLKIVQFKQKEAVRVFITDKELHVVHCSHVVSPRLRLVHREQECYEDKFGACKWTSMSQYCVSWVGSTNKDSLVVLVSDRDKDQFLAAVDHAKQIVRQYC